MSLGKKLLIAALLNMLNLLACALVGQWSAYNFEKAQTALLTINSAMTNHMNGDMMHDALRGDVISALFSTTTTGGIVGSPDEIKTLLAEHQKEFLNAIDSNKKLDLPIEIVTELKGLEGPLQAYIQSADTLVKSSSGNTESALAQYPKFIAAFNELETRMGATRDIIEKVAKERVEQSTLVESRARFAMIAAMLFAIVAAIAVFLFLDRSVTRVIRVLSRRLTECSSELRSAAGQVASSSQALAQGATEQAASLEESAASIEEISSMSKHNTENSNQAQRLADSVKGASQSGVQLMGSMTEAIHSIKKSGDETAQIVKMIDEIAFQTNLLALNAAVEAARAGDAGKGFAVVAEEVRSLAQRSANAAKESSEKIRQSKELADNGVRVTADVASSLTTINQDAVKSSDLMREIAAASREQTTGIGQVNIAVAELDKVTQQNSAAAEESAAAAEEMSAQADTLMEITNALFAIVDGRNARTSTHSIERKEVVRSRSSSPLVGIVSKSPSVGSSIVNLDEDDTDFWNASTDR